jgi:hypothetical protein
MTRKGILEYHNRDCQCYTLGRRKSYKREHLQPFTFDCDLTIPISLLSSGVLAVSPWTSGVDSPSSPCQNPSTAGSCLRHRAATRTSPDAPDPTASGVIDVEIVSPVVGRVEG